MKTTIPFFIFGFFFFQECHHEPDSMIEPPIDPIDTIPVSLDSLPMNRMKLTLNDQDYTLFILGLPNISDSSRFDFAAQRLFAPNQNPDIGITFSFLPMLKGVYKLNQHHFPLTKQIAHLAITDLDAIVKSYQVDTLRPAWLEIEKADLDSLIFEGKFEVHFLQAPPFSATYVDRIDLLNGRFKVKLGY